MEENEYQDFIVADNESETANTQSEETTEQVETDVVENETETEETIETTEETKEKTETQRVSQRINEAKQQAIDSHISKQGYEWNGKPITTEAQYNEAIAEQKQQQEDEVQREKYQASELPEEVINELLESRRDRAERKIEKTEQDKAKAQQKMYTDFTSKFPDTKPEDIKTETWQEVNEGSSLVDAYTRQENAELKAKLKVYEQNKSTKSKAPLNQGINTHGSDEIASEDDFMRGFNSI